MIYESSKTPTRATELNADVVENSFDINQLLMKHSKSASSSQPTKMSTNRKGSSRLQLFAEANNLQSKSIQIVSDIMQV